MSETPADQDRVQVRVDGACGTILLNRPDRRNALSREMIRDLRVAFDDLHQQPGVRSVVITGAGEFFSAGTDMLEIQQTQEDQDHDGTIWFQDVEQLRDLITSMFRYPKPIIAAINGPALGMGATLMLACDLVVAAKSATVGFPENYRGLSAGLAAPLAAFRIGAGPTAHLLFRGHTIEAGEAWRVGLVHEVVDFDFLWAKSAEIANEIAEQSHVAISMSKRVLNETVGEATLTQLTVAAASMATGRTTHAAREGIAAFFEKRNPDWDRQDDPS